MPVGGFLKRTMNSTNPYESPRTIEMTGNFTASRTPGYVTALIACLSMLVSLLLVTKTPWFGAAMLTATCVMAGLSYRQLNQAGFEILSAGIRGTAASGSQKFRASAQWQSITRVTVDNQTVHVERRDAKQLTFPLTAIPAARQVELCVLLQQCCHHHGIPLGGA